MYQSMGFAPLGYTHDEHGKPMFCVQIPGETAFAFNILIKERKLPRSSLNDPIEKRVAEFRKAEQREPNRKEFAAMRDAIEAKMLSQAPVVPKIIPVIIMDSRCVMFTSSPTQAELCGNLLRTVLGTWPTAHLFKDEMDLSDFMRNVIGAHKRFEMLDKADDNSAEIEEPFFPGQSAKFVDGSDSKISIRNELISNVEGWGAQDALDRAYDPVELEFHFVGTGNAMVLGEDFKPVYIDRTVVTLSNNGVVKKFAMPDLEAPDLHNMTDNLAESDNIETAQLANAAMLYMITREIRQLNKEFDKAGILKTDPVSPDLVCDSGFVDGGFIGLRDEEADQDVLDEVVDIDEELAPLASLAPIAGLMEKVMQNVTAGMAQDPATGQWEVFCPDRGRIGQTEYKNVAEYWFKELQKDPDYEPDLDDFTPAGIPDEPLDDDDI